MDPLTANPKELKPRTLATARLVDVALIQYQDESNQTVTQLAVVGENEVHLLESRALGFTHHTTPQGRAAGWLRDQVLKTLGRKK